MGATVFYLATVNATTIYQFKGKDTEIKKYALCLGNISGDFSAYNMKKTGLNGCVCNFSVDYCHQFKRKTKTISWIAESQECVLPRVEIKGSWFVNQGNICLGNIWGDFSAYNMKKTGLNGCVCNFSVDYCHQFKRKTETISWIAESQECVLPRVGIKGCWFVNHESISWSHKPKISKSSIFCECFFPKYGNLKIISADDLGAAST